MTEPQYFHSEAAGDSAQPNPDVWRKEIHSRVSRYRTRRGRRIEGAFSMRFPFPPAEPGSLAHAVASEVASPEPEILVAEVSNGAESAAIDTPIVELPGPTTQPIVAAEPAEITSKPIADVTEPSVEPVPSALAEIQPEAPPVVQTRPRPKRKVIAFPRQTPASESVYRLADPVFPEQPRILDVPEELEAFPSTPFLDGLQFDASPQAPAVPREHIELPFRVVSRSHRIYAALVDCSLVAAAAAIFAAICHKMLPKLDFTKPVLLTAAVAPVLFWAIYQYLLLVYAGRTAGMQVARIRLSTFKGTRPSLRHRRNRVVGLYLSTASLIMGLLWALVDVDALCWHDRMSGTYLTKRE